MSTLLPSASARPFVSSGIAVTPPVPLDVLVPGPVFLNHNSSVKTCAPSVGAAPNVTRSSTPSNCSAYSGAALTLDDGEVINRAQTTQRRTLTATEYFLGRMHISVEAEFSSLNFATGHYSGELLQSSGPHRKGESIKSRAPMGPRSQ